VELRNYINVFACVGRHPEKNALTFSAMWFPCMRASKFYYAEYLKDVVNVGFFKFDDFVFQCENRNAIHYLWMFPLSLYLVSSAKLLNLMPENPERKKEEVNAFNLCLTKM
jgi:hypothetical protein